MRLVGPMTWMFLGSVFLLSGIDKAAHYAGFVNALSAYVLVPKGWGPLLAPAIVTLELLAGAGLFIPQLRRQAFLLTIILLVCFTTGLTFNYIFGVQDICGCWFTLTLAEGQALHIFYNVVLLLLAVLQLYPESNARQRQELHLLRPEDS